MSAAVDVIRRLAELPGGTEVLELAAPREDVELVGGAVRDLMLGRRPLEIDLVLDGEPASFPHESAVFARALAARIGAAPQVSVHERFGTAALQWPLAAEGGVIARVDIAARRAESYASPGALPQVRPGTPEEDLRRRDFTINAIAVGLGGARRGQLREIDGAQADLRAGLLRVIHPDSFSDDPTRLMRMARYAARLGFEIESQTERLARAALRQGALQTVSAARVGAELRLAVVEGDPVAALASLQRLGVLAAIDSRLRLEPQTLALALELLSDDGRPELLALAATMVPIAIAPARAEAQALLDGWELPAPARRAVLAAATGAPSLAERIGQAQRPSELARLLSGLPVEAVALAGATAEREGRAGAAGAARAWLTQLRHVRLEIGGAELLAAGLQPGPEIGRRLERLLAQRLDGTIGETAQAQLRAALRG